MIVVKTLFAIGLLFFAILLVLQITTRDKTPEESPITWEQMAEQEARDEAGN